jgi:hypothetical protein
MSKVSCCGRFGVKSSLGEGTIDWSFFDQGVALAAKYNKKLGLLIRGGVTTPQWFTPLERMKQSDDNLTLFIARALLRFHVCRKKLIELKGRYWE